MKTLRINCVCNCAVPGCTGSVLTLQLLFHPENSEVSLQATNFSRDYCEVVVFYVFTTSKDPWRRGKAVRWCMKKQPRFKNGVQKKMLPNRIRCPDSNSLNACRFRFCFSFFLRLVINRKHLRINGKFYCMFAKMCFQSLITVFTGVSGIVEGKHERSLSVIHSNWHVSRTESLLFWFRASKRSV